MKTLFITLILCFSASSFAFNSSSTQLMSEKNAQVEKKTFTGIIKSRQRDAEDGTKQVVYYIELPSGEKVHISTNCDSDELKKHENKNVTIKTRLREKTNYSNDFIRQIYSFETANSDF